MTDVLVVDPSALCRELMGRILEAQGYTAQWAEPEGAFETLRRCKPAVLIVEPGVAGSPAWRLLEVLHRARPQFDALQVIILTDASDKSAVLRAAEMGVRNYMLKAHFSLAELLTRVRRYAAPSQPAQKGMAGAAPAAAAAAPTDGATGPAASASSAVVTATATTPLAAFPPATVAPAATPDEDRCAILAAAEAAGIPCLTREQTLARLEKAPVKTLPGVVAELIGLVSSPRGSVADVAQLLRRDPVLTARVLRIANSAAFASDRLRVANVEDAVKNIGVSGVRNLVLNVGVFDAFAAGGPDGLRVMRVWQHCLGVAMLMERLAPQDPSAPPGSAYLVGLCHDLSDLVLRQQFAHEYEAITGLVTSTGRPLRQAEAAIFGLPYADLVSHLLTRLRLPPLITVPIEEFFERGDRKSAAAGSGSLLGRALRATNVYAHGLMLAAGVDQPVTPLTRAECNSTFGNAADATIDDDALRGDALATASVLGGLSPEQTAQMCQTLVPRHDLRVAYVRHGDYGALDPLAALLRLATREVEVLAPSAAAAGPPSLISADAVVMAGARAGGAEAFARDMEILRRLRVAGLRAAVLYLSGPGAAAAPNDLAGVVTRLLPVTIETLGAFLASAAGAGSSHALAAAA